MTLMPVLQARCSELPLLLSTKNVFLKAGGERLVTAALEVNVADEVKLRSSDKVRLTFRNSSELRLHKRQVEVTLSRRQGAALRVTAQPDACVQNYGGTILVDYAAARETAICISPSRSWEQSWGHVLPVHKV